MPPKKSSNAAKPGKKVTNGKENSKYAGWLVKQLKDELKARGLPVGGLKDALLERLEGNDKEMEEADGGVKVSKVDVDRRKTFTVDQPKTGKPKGMKELPKVPEPLIEDEEDGSEQEEDLEATRVISKDDNNVMFKGFCPDPDGKSEQEDRSLPVKIHQDERRDNSISQEEGETTDENDETVKAMPAKTPAPQPPPPVLQRRHTYRLEGPDGAVNEIHAETIVELLEKMKMLVVQDAMEAAAEATSPPPASPPFTDGSGVNKNKVDGASPVSTTDDDDNDNEEEGLISDDEEEEEEILRF